MVARAEAPVRPYMIDVGEVAKVKHYISHVNLTGDELLGFEKYIRNLLDQVKTVDNPNELRERYSVLNIIREEVEEGKPMQFKPERNAQGEINKVTIAAGLDGPTLSFEETQKLLQLTFSQDLKIAKDVLETIRAGSQVTMVFPEAREAVKPDYWSK